MGIIYYPTPGLVSSVTFTGDGIVLSSTPSAPPVVAAGTVTATLNTQAANLFLAGPSSAGPAATPTFRAIVAADVPNISASKITTGVLALAQGGNTFSALGDLIYGGAAAAPTILSGNITTTKKFLTQTGTSSVSAAPSWGTIATADLPAGVPIVVASGTSALGTSAIGSGAAASVVSTSATGALTTDNILADFTADPTGTTGYAPTAAGMLTIVKYITADHVNFVVVNNTGASITPGAVTLQWRVIR